jgi:2-phosphoglycerate kinase
MDIVRIFAQMIEEQKPKLKRNKFVQFGSCDSYTLVGDGTLSNSNIIEGFKLYSQAVFEPVKQILPKLETQGCEHLILEGVQIAPDLVSSYLSESARLVVITASLGQLTRNKAQIFGDNKVLESRYSNEVLSLVQNEVIRELEDLKPGNYAVFENDKKPEDCRDEILDYLLSTGYLE